MKGHTLAQGQVVVLALDGTLVYVEEVQPTFAGVVALPEQPPERADDRVFTPGRVGAKKISPFAQAERIVEEKDLSDRNKGFIAGYAALRQQHGNNHVERTPEEQAVHDAAQNPPDKNIVKAAKKAARDAEKAQRRATKAGPKFLQRCKQCGEQRGHPNHPNDHEFIEPPLPALRCAACDEEATADVHSKTKEEGGHRFVASGKAPKAPKEPKPDAAPQLPKKAPKARLVGKYRWVDDDMRLGILRAANGKYNEGNSGNALIELIRAAGETGLSPLEVVGQPKCPSTLERAELAFAQLLGAGLLEAVS